MTASTARWSWAACGARSTPRCSSVRTHAEPGDYVLVHVGFALSAISEAEANETLRILEEMGPAYTDELEQIRQSEAMELELVGPDYRRQVTEI